MQPRQGGLSYAEAASGTGREWISVRSACGQCAAQQPARAWPGAGPGAGVCGGWRGAFFKCAKAPWPQPAPGAWPAAGAVRHGTPHFTAGVLHARRSELTGIGRQFDFLTRPWTFRPGLRARARRMARWCRLGRGRGDGCHQGSRIMMGYTVARQAPSRRRVVFY